MDTACISVLSIWCITRLAVAVAITLHGRIDDNAEGCQSDVYAEQRKADMRIGEATDVMIDGLRQLHQWAIHKKCGITTAWKFPSADYLETLEDAEKELTTKLKNNIATATQFG